MIKNKENGITLISLIITMVVLAILISISLVYSLNQLKDLTTKTIQMDLSMIQEAIIQRYSLFKTANKADIIAGPITENVSFNADDGRPKELIGIRIPNVKSFLDEEFGENNKYSEINFPNDFSVNTEGKKYEEYYYLLKENDLINLGLSRDGDDSDQYEAMYIVNYMTGEVYYIDNSDDDPIFIQPYKVLNVNDNKYEFKDD